MTQMRQRDESPAGPSDHPAPSRHQQATTASPAHDQRPDGSSNALEEFFKQETERLNSKQAEQEQPKPPRWHRGVDIDNL